MAFFIETNIIPIEKILSAYFLNLCCGPRLGFLWPTKQILILLIIRSGVIVVL